ncbi:MAG: hypothetical protein EO766_03920 [Hydrotalea sp. AMD]|uniref:hypothetical protein n=1 Tax=Hydrotalea sp. AMD TaxID=2501297 RepID=UPI000942BFB4|nr:hypothetical protein [Hydrotalea sp. AMD]RWZ89857.1 MAG: hypothetical protein EO766_03920 [Hydrotalea sp. AMD]
MAAIILFPILLFMDAAHDWLFHEWDVHALFSTENMLFKGIVAGIGIGGYFYVVLTQRKNTES